MSTYVYVDGFNFYYGAVKGTPYKWLNLDDLCRRLLPKHQIVKIKYYTAGIIPLPHNPGQQSRQNTYLRALRTLPNLEIHLGRFLSHPRRMPLVGSSPTKPRYATVIKTEEKGSDVNLATHLVSDGYKGIYQVAVVISNDSDLVEPIRLVRQELGLVVGVLYPSKKPSYDLQRYASFVKPIRAGALAASQFPDQLTDTYGAFHKPGGW
jgi:uncharacterized LabA/DUF88 family protein